MARNLGQFDPEICGNLVWKVLANLTWNLGEYGPESPSQFGLALWDNMAWKIWANLA